MEEFIANQIKYGVKYVPKNFVKSFFIPKTNAETRKWRDKGFICGVCHPNEDYEKLAAANIRWIRVDIPYPYTETDGEWSESFLNFKERCRGYVEHGFKIMAVTPYPQSFLACGHDIRKAGEDAKIAAITCAAVEDLRGLVHGLQVCNEMGIPRFTHPFTMQEAAHFIGVQLKALAAVQGDILVGYNSAGPQADLHALLQPYYRYMDYVGFDLYVGCFFGYPGFLWMYDALARYLWAMTGKPVLVQEFGYISAGKPKTRAEKQAILRGYGVKNEKDARAHLGAFIDRLPPRIREETLRLYNTDDERYTFLLRGDMRQHIYRELGRFCKVPGMEHTPEGQAKFYATVIPRFHRVPYMAGAIVYCYSDTDHCYVCGQEGCPTETRWGLVTCDGTPKPSYYAVQKAFGAIKQY